MPRESVLPLPGRRRNCALCRRCWLLCGKICRRRTWPKNGEFLLEIQGQSIPLVWRLDASYAAKNIPHVPYAQGNKEMYPIIQSRTTLVKDILTRYVTPVSNICERGIETAVYEDGMILVNHRSTPFVLPQKYQRRNLSVPMAWRKGRKGYSNRSRGCVGKLVKS